MGLAPRGLAVAVGPHRGGGLQATLDDIARELAEMKAEARQFLTAQELSR